MISRSPIRSIAILSPLRVRLARKYSTIIPEPSVNPAKPKISQFGHAIFNTVTISLTTYLLLHSLWTNLEYREVEADLVAKSNDLESQVHTIVTELKQEELKKRQSWVGKLKFW